MKYQIIVEVQEVQATTSETIIEKVTEAIQTIDSGVIVVIERITTDE